MEIMNYYREGELVHLSRGIKGYFNTLILGLITGGIIALIFHKKGVGAWAEEPVAVICITIFVLMVLRYRSNSSRENRFKLMRETIYEKMMSTSAGVDFFSFGFESCFGLDVKQKQFIYTKIRLDWKVDTFIFPFDDIKSIGYECDPAIQWTSQSLRPSASDLRLLEKKNKASAQAAAYQRGLKINFEDVIRDPFFIKPLHIKGIEKWSNIIEEAFAGKLTPRDEPYRVS